MNPDASAFGFVVRTTACVLLLLASWRFMIVPTLNDMFRQRLFEIRRSLFLLVVDNKLSPAEPAYRQLRDTINGLLRFAERATLARMIMSNKLLPLNIEAYTKRTEQALSQMKDPAAREELENHRERVGFEIVRHIVLTSPELWPVLFALVVGTMSIGAAKSWLKKQRPIGIEVEAAEEECFMDGALPA